jgi:hypothetical protein
MKKTNIVICGVLALLVSCAPSVVLNKTWKSESPKGKTLAIVLPEKNIKIDYVGDVNNEFGTGEPNKVIRNSIRHFLKCRIIYNTVFDNVWYDQFAGDVKFSTIEINDNASDRGLPGTSENDEAPKVPIPVQNSDVRLKKSQADFVFYLDRLTVSSHGSVYVNTAPVATSTGFSSGITGGGFSKSLNFYSRFVLWDVRQKCAVAHGYTSGSKGFGLYISLDDWYVVADDMVKEIFEKPKLLRETYKKPLVADEKNHVEKTCFVDPINLSGKRIAFLAGPTITKNDIDSAEARSIKKSEQRSSDKMKEGKECFSWMPAPVPGTRLDTASTFTKGYARFLADSVAPGVPVLPVTDPAAISALGAQLQAHFSELDTPIDSLNQTTLDIVTKAPADYAVVFYTRFTQPKPDDDIDEIDKNDLNFYCNLIDLKTNVSITDCYLSLHDVLDYVSSPEETYERRTMARLEIAMNIYARLAKHQLQTVATW